ncbi:uncharacterized protein [Typha latifolia]|uniref:uncharacterized protein n=1 Tax=Typha latifolia TaxID=4733 RepID=UPI003C2D1891
MATSRPKEGPPRLREKVSSSTLASADTHHGRRLPKPLSLPDRIAPSLSSKPSTSFCRTTASSSLSNASTHGKIHHPPGRKLADKSPSTRTRTAPANERGLKTPKETISLKTKTYKPSNAISRSGRTHALVRAQSPGTTTKRIEANAPISTRGNAHELTQTPTIISELEEIKHSMLDELPDPILNELENSEPTCVSPPQDVEHETSSLGEVSEASTVIEVEGIEIDESKDEEKPKERLEEPKGEEGDGEKLEVGTENTPLEQSNVVFVEPTKKQMAPVVVVVKKQETMQGMKKEAPKNNDVIEETRSKLMEKRKSKVKALVGAFETVMSLQEPEGQTVEKSGEEHSQQST